MTESFMGQSALQESKPLQSIKSIQQSLLILKHKLWQMNKRENQNAKQIEKVFYSSIPILKTKLSQSVQCQKFQQKKKNQFNQSVLRERTKMNRQRKMINEKEIQRNRQLISMMKINQHNAIREMSKKNLVYIEKMKNHRVELNRKKKEQVKGKIENSRLKVQDFKTTKLEQIRKQKQEQSMIMKQKMNKMMSEMSRLADKQNETVDIVDRSEEVLRQLRFAVDKMQKMNENDFIRLKNKIRIEDPSLDEEKIVERILLAIIEAQKSRTPNKLTKSMHNSRWSSGHLSKIA